MCIDFLLSCSRERNRKAEALSKCDFIHVTSTFTPGYGVIHCSMKLKKLCIIGEKVLCKIIIHKLCKLVICLITTCHKYLAFFTKLVTNS